MKGGISLISKYVRVVGIDDDVYAIYNNLLFKPVFARKTEIDEILEENVSAEYKKALKDIGIKDAQGNEQVIDSDTAHACFFVPYFAFV